MTTATASLLPGIGLLLIAALTAGWLLSSVERLRWASALLLLASAPAVLAWSIVGDATSSLPALSPLTIMAALVAGTALLAAVVFAFVRWPRAVLPAALATLAFRVPLEIGSETVRLLLPLYLVIGAAVLARAFDHWRGRTPYEPRPPKLLDVAIVLFLSLYALQSLYVADSAEALRNFCFFYAPFALLYGLAARQRWDARLLGACLATLVAVALVLVAGGFVEFSRGSYLITIGGARPSDFDPYFRVQSFFFDPNIYGRFLAVVMLAVTSVMLRTGRSSRVLGSALVLALLWAGLVLSLSQSSFAALLAGLVVLAALRWRAKPVLLMAGAALLAGLVIALSLPSVTGIDLTSGKKAEATTSGRFDLVTGGLTLFSQRPLFGYGSGGFSAAYSEGRLAKHTTFGPVVTTKSHTAPLTVAAEQGIVGLAAYALLIWAGFAAVFRRAGRSDGPFGVPGTAARAAVAAAFTALFVHSLSYAAFLEDPLTWLVAGCAVSLAAIPRATGAAATADESSA